MGYQQTQRMRLHYWKENQHFCLSYHVTQCLSTVIKWTLCGSLMKTHMLSTSSMKQSLLMMLKCHTVHFFPLYKAGNACFLHLQWVQFLFFSKHWFLTIITLLESPSSAWYFIEAEDCYLPGTNTVFKG